jgi:gluconate 2-dehydrogenase gamma chain
MRSSRDITRREAVQRLGVLLGGAVSASTVTALLSGCRATPPATASGTWSPAVLSGEQLDVLTVVVDRILPRTDTPGASDVGVPAFIDVLLDRWARDGEKERVLAGLDELGADFLGAPEAEQVARLEALDAESVQARQGEERPLPYFATLKEWTLAGYYTSEAGATEELQWLAVPGRYDADLPLEQVGRTWA